MIKNAEIVNECIKQIKSNADIAVVGMSGGADSTLVATLCVKALGKNNVYGLHLPFGEVDKETFNKKSVKTASHLGTNQLTIDIEPAFKALTSHFNVDKLTNGNTRARLRMTSLYFMAGMLGCKHPNKRVRVMNTCNLSESYIGYETKFGDGAGDIAPIGELFKSEVYQLLDYFKEQGILTEDLIDRIPSAGLWEGQTDEGELGYTYNEMEPVIKRLLNLSGTKNQAYLVSFESDLERFVWGRHQANKHKHEAPPIIELREFCD